MNSIPRLFAVLPRIKQVSVYLKECRLVVTMMTGNPNFPNPALPLAQVSAHLDTLQACEEGAGGGPDAVAKRDVALALVQKDMRLLRAQVQDTADGNPLEAAVIITGASMTLGKKRGPKKAPVGAKHGDIPGQVVLDCKALPKPVEYRWQMSTDQKTWSDVPESFKTKVIVDGLSPATVYYFRLRTLTRAGLSDWSSVVSIIAH